MNSGEIFFVFILSVILLLSIIWGSLVTLKLRRLSKQKYPILGSILPSTNFTGSPMLSWGEIGDAALSNERLHDLRLDVAFPSKTNQPIFEIAAAIRISDDEILELSSLDNTITGKGFAIQQENLGVLRFRIRAIARGCKPEVSEEDVVAQIGKSIEPIYFQFKSQQENGVSIIINAYQVIKKERLIASVRAYVDVDTSNQNHREPELLRQDLNQKLTIKKQLYEWLNDVFSISELEDLCFRLGVNWDNVIGGSDKQKRIRELIFLFDRFGKLEELNLTILRLRPKLLS